MARCQGITKTGKPCRAPATAGGLCFLHANPSQARELGRVGGRKNRQQEPELPSPKSMTIAQLNEVLIGTLHGLQSKKVSARRASAVVQVCGALQRTLPAADLEARVSRLEERMAEGAPGVSFEVAPEGARLAAPAEIGEQASEPNGSATAKAAEVASEDCSRSGSNSPEPAKK